jgi:hypothetical protein
MERNGTILPFLLPVKKGRADCASSTDVLRLTFLKKEAINGTLSYKGRPVCQMLFMFPINKYSVCKVLEGIVRSDEYNCKQLTLLDTYVSVLSCEGPIGRVSLNSKFVAGTMLRS